MINSHFGSLEGLAARQIVQLFGVQFRSVKKVRASRGWGKLVHGDVVKAYSQWVPTMRVQGKACKFSACAVLQNAWLGWQRIGSLDVQNKLCRRLGKDGG